VGGSKAVLCIWIAIFKEEHKEHVNKYLVESGYYFVGKLIELMKLMI